MSLPYGVVVGLRSVIVAFLVIFPYRPFVLPFFRTSVLTKLEGTCTLCAQLLLQFSLSTLSKLYRYFGVHMGCILSSVVLLLLFHTYNFSEGTLCVLILLQFYSEFF